MLTPERIKELSDRHLRVVGAGYVRPQDAEEFARAIESEVRRLHAENADRAVRAPADSVLEDAERLDWLDQQCEAYGFQDIHEGNRWEISGAYANVRKAIDAERAARKQGENHD